MKKQIDKYLSTSKLEEKTRVLNEINEIFKSKEIISEGLLKLIRERAKSCNIDDRKINDLDSYIGYTKIIREAEILLTKKYDELKVNSQLSSIKNINTSNFNLEKKIKLNILLLESYCDKSQYLLDTFNKIDKIKAGVSADDLKFELQAEKNLYTSFPYLFEEINKKINNLNYKSSLKQCY